MGPERTTQSDRGGCSIQNDRLIRGSLHLDLFTDFSQEWELDRFKPQMYIASIFYMNRDPQYEKEKPYFFNIPVSDSWVPEVRQTNVCYTRKTVAITNIRGHEGSFGLDKQGFQITKMLTGLSYDDFAVTETITTRFYPEVKDLLLRLPGSIDVLPFDFQVRRNDPTLPAGSRGAPGKAQPFAAVHGDNVDGANGVDSWGADQTTNAAFRRLKHFHPEYALKTVRDGDRVPTDIIFPDYLGETYNLWPNSGHRFYFIDGQESDEAWMIKCFDSETNANPEIAQFAPHVSFPYGEVGDNFQKRESVEKMNEIKIEIV
ncbi:hypothetical protein FACUT_8945 [Fusarium acutatum]|uniref:Uncharacterized protein n=1 Tax=Fusarium acutatum TaxID=78861 RepID=A0A8H4NIL5_9HYPO|nr:hypothetical protein FACUT_8945 [Fusarium acutatum]